MALSFIGKPISLISHSDVRYRGILAGIDTQASTIQLSKVYSMGTESRRPPAEFIPPVPDPYEYIIFRASEVKDLAVDDPPVVRRSIHDDPAVLGAGPTPAPQQVPAAAFNNVPPQAAASFAQQSRGGPAPRQAQHPNQAPGSANQRRRPNNNANTGGVETASASLESVERAMSDLRVSGGNNGGNARRGGAANASASIPVKVPAHDFDFASSNAKFDKSGGKVARKGSESSEASEEEDDGEAAKKKKDSAAYNPTKSFFDTLTPGPQNARRGRGRGGGGGGAGNTGNQIPRANNGNPGRNRREEERERNVATFGEPGGIGLLGAGNYVGGWGGYARHGRGRGGARRGAPRGQ